MGARLCKYLNYMNENSITNIKVTHEDVYGRDELDQHPISAITGLQLILNSLDSALRQLENNTDNISLELKKEIQDLKTQLEYLTNNIDPSRFISSDSGNNLTLGTDNKLMVGHISGSTSNNSITVDNVTSGMNITIPKAFDSDFSSVGAVTVWEYKEGGTNEDKVLDYTSESKNKYIPNNKLEFTNVGVEPKTDYEIVFNYNEQLDNEYSLYTATIDLDEFKRFEVI